MNSDFKFYTQVFMQRLPVMAVIFLICAGIGIGLAMVIPPRYQADATLLVESAQIEGATVVTPAAEQLQITEQRLMTRANLIDIANQFNVFAGEARLSPDEVVERMRELTEISTRSGRDRATFMGISFTAGDAKVAAGVVNEFVDIVLNEDAERRQLLAGDRLNFYQQEVQRLQLELAERSAAIVAFKEANKNALPEGQDFRLERQAQLQERMNLALRDRAALNEQRNRLIAVGTAGAPAPAVQLTPEQQQLAQLRSELTSALSIYSETNPRVKLLRARIENLESAAQPASEEGEAASGSSANTVLDIQLAEIDSRISLIDEDIARAEQQLELLQGAIDQTPENAIRLEGLEREYLQTETFYNQAVAARAEAETGDRIEALSRGERISVVEQAVAPTEPNAPNRNLIAGGGVFAGTALASLFFALTELLNRSIRRPIELTRALGVQPLATIPYLEDAASRKRRRALKTILIVGILLAIPIALWVIHTFYMPLDLVMIRLTQRLGL